MIQEYNVLDVADNTGAREVTLLQSAGRLKRRYASIGDVINASTAKHSRLPRRGKKGRDHARSIVRVAKECGRDDGSLIRFDTNAAVLLTDQIEPIGTRIFGPVSANCVRERFMKIVSLAPEVL